MTESLVNLSSSQPLLAQMSTYRRDPFTDKSRLMWRIAAPIILLSGLTGNVLTMIVLKSLRSNSASYRFLQSLTLTDLLYLAVGCFLSWWGHEFGTFFQDTGSASCRLYKWLVFSLGMLSAVLLTTMTVHRVLAHMLLHRVHGLCVRRLAGDLVVLETLLCFGLSLYLPFSVDIRAGKCRWTENFQEKHLKTVAWMNAVMYMLLPTLIVLLCNCYLVWSLVHLPSEEHSSDLRLRARLTGFSFMAVVVSLMFVLLTLPLTVAQLMAASDPSWLQLGLFRFCRELALICMYTNSAVKFFCYLWTGKQFRRQLVYVFCLDTAVRPQFHGASVSKPSYSSRSKSHTSSEF